MYVVYRYQHVTVSQHYLPRRLRSTVSCNKTPATVFKVNLCRFVAMLLLRNKDQQQNNPLATFAIHLCRQKRDMSELQAHHCMTLQLWTWLLCSVSFIQAKKLSLQESNQFIGSKIPTSVFSRNIRFLIPTSRRGANARFASPALRTPMRSLTILYQVPWTRPAYLMKRRSAFD